MRQTCQTSQIELQSARTDAEYYRSQVEELRDHQRQQDEQRQREQKEKRNRLLPSNRLYNGEVTDFLDAINCHIAACEHEITSPEPADDEDMIKTIAHCNQTMSESIARATKARQIYNTITQETLTRISAALQAEDLTNWSECLDTGDYSSMAI